MPSVIGQEGPVPQVSPPTRPLPDAAEAWREVADRLNEILATVKAAGRITLAIDTNLLIGGVVPVKGKTIIDLLCR